MALSDKKVVLIGMDLRKPKIYGDFNLKNDMGMTNYLIGKATVDQIIHHTQISTLDIIPAGPIPPNPAELILDDRMDQIIQELKTRYDYIIIDTPPVGLVTDAQILMKYADITIYVVREGYSVTTFTETINDLYETKGIKNLYLLLNDTRIYSKKYGMDTDMGTDTGMVTGMVTDTGTVIIQTMPAATRKHHY